MLSRTGVPVMLLMVGDHDFKLPCSRGPTDTLLGLGPLSALELYYGRKINPGWGICFLLTSQMIGYAFTGIYRDILVRPPKIYYPGGKKDYPLCQTLDTSSFELIRCSSSQCGVVQRYAQESIRHQEVPEILRYCSLCYLLLPVDSWVHISPSFLPSLVVLLWTRAMEGLFDGFRLL